MVRAATARAATVPAVLRAASESASTAEIAGSRDGAVRFVVSTDTLEFGSGIGFDVQHVRDIVLRIDRESLRAQRL
jgi:hypothetical protein